MLSPVNAAGSWILSGTPILAPVEMEKLSITPEIFSLPGSVSRFTEKCVVASRASWLRVGSADRLIVMVFVER